MLTNKWIMVALSGIAALAAWASAQDWTHLLDAHTAVVITGVLTTITTVLHALLPGPSQSVDVTGNSIVTHS